MNRRSFIRVLGLGAAASTLPAVWPEGTAPAIVEAAGPRMVYPPWICSGYLGPMFEQVKGMAQKVGRDSASLELIVRANVEFADPTPGQDRVHFTGTLSRGYVFGAFC